MATVTSEKGIARTWAGVAAASLKDQATDLRRVFRTPRDFELDLGVKTRTTDGSNPLGEKVLIDRFIDETKPEFMLTLSGANTEFFGLQSGREVVKITGSSELLTFRKQALTATTAAVPIGAYGYEILADAVSTAGAKLGGDLSVELTQQPFATFVPATALTFAVGAAGAFKFSTDLVTARAYIDVVVPATVDVQSLSETNIGFMDAQIVLRNSDDTVTLCHVPTIQVNAEGSKISASADSTVIKASVIITGCQGFTLKDYSNRLSC